MNTEIASTVDILLLVSSLWFILQVSERSIFNPSLWWVALHTYTVTFRLITLNLGVQSISFIGVRSNAELVNAAIASDISLVAVVAATIFDAQRRQKYSASNSPKNTGVQLNPRVGQIISILCLTIGTYALLKFGGAATAARARGIDVSAIDIGRLEQSSYPITIAGFAVQGALLQCALRGFTRWRVVMLVVLLTASSLNLARAAFILAAAMAFLIYQTQQNRTNVPAKWAIGVLLLGLVWFVFKPVARAIADSQDVHQIIASGQDYLIGAVSANGSSDMQFFDMQATYMAAADEAGQRFYGATVVPLLYLPIPRIVWPDKPRMNEYAYELSSPLRPITQVGMVPLLSGESYLNFGWIGCAVIPFLYILGMQIAFQWVRDRGITSAARFIYLVFLVSMVQVFRDGLSSLVIFPIVWYFPLVGWGVISKLMEVGRLHRGHFNQRYAIH